MNPDPNTPAGRSANPGAWKPLPAEHLPAPTYWPPAFGAAITFIIWGLIAGRVVLACGLILFTISLAGWIREIRNESHDTHE